MKKLLILIIAIAGVPQARADVTSATVGICAAFFEDATFEQELLPEQIQLPNSRTEIASLFALAKENFAVQFSETTARTFAKKVLNDEPISKKEIKALRNYRKISQTARSAYVLFGSIHAPPVHFDKFIRSLGKMIDGTNSKSLSKAKKNAQLVLNGLDDKAIELSQYSMGSSTVDSFRNFILATEAKILSMTRAPDISILQYHDMRKLMRHFKNLFDLIYTKNNSTNLQSVNQFFDTLNQKLGDSKDDLKSEEDDLDDNVEARTFIPKSYKDAIEDFFERLI